MVWETFIRSISPLSVFDDPLYLMIKPRTMRSTVILLVLVIVFFQTGKVAAQSGVYAESPDISDWVEERTRRARLGRPERVRFPLVRRSDGWGCICPEYYLGLSTVNAGPQLWIEPRFARSALRFPKNTIVLAEGYFTGRRPRRDLRSSPDEPEEMIYKLWKFSVTRVQRVPDNHDFYDETSPTNRAVILSSPVGLKRRRR